MTNEHWWKIALRLKLRQSSGDAFQEFFSLIMEKLHGEDFIRVRPFGSKGDKGCDGYLKSPGQVFQCYGALNGDKGKVDYLINKMDEDFPKAKDKLTAIMKEWHMVHNLVDGLPVQAVEKLHQFKTENANIEFGFVGLEGFEKRIEKFTQEQKTELLGPAATNQDAQDLQLTELKNLIDGVVVAADGSDIETGEIAPVPVDKLEANKLPYHWKCLIEGGWRNAHIVVAYLDQHHNPLIGQNIAQLFNARYQYLKAQKLEPATIMDSLYEYVTGIGTVAPPRQVAAQALLAHLFESCDIFENLTGESVL